jgi:metallo-beta-lactamase class B
MSISGNLRAPALLAASLATFVPVYASAAQDPMPCKQCEEWNISQQPVRIYGNTYYVGVHGLSSILITSPDGDILIDGDIAESAPKIAANIAALGFRMTDIKLILNSHVHYDHAGGIAELQRLSGARVEASPATAKALEQGHSGPDDPQYGILPPINPVAHVKAIKDGATLHVGSLTLTAHFTPGHTPGSTSWTWQSCEQDRCLNLAYVDSLTAVSAPGFHFSSNTSLRRDFEKSFATVSALPCDILLTPHPDASDLWSRLERRDKGEADALIDSMACKRLANLARANFDKRLAQESAEKP